MTDLVTQADREAAAQYMEAAGWCIDLRPIRAGACDTPLVKAFARYRISVLEEAAKVAETRYAALLGPATWQAAGDEIATAIRSLSQPVEGSAGASVGPGAMASDPYDLANMLRGYVDRGTPPVLAAFLLERSEAAVALADEVVRLRAAVAASNKGGRDGE